MTNNEVLIEELKQTLEDIEKEWNNFHANNIHTCYSYPTWQARAIKKKIEELTIKQ